MRVAVLRPHGWRLKLVDRLLLIGSSIPPSNVVVYFQIHGNPTTMLLFDQLFQVVFILSLSTLRLDYELWKQRHNITLKPALQEIAENHHMRVCCNASSPITGEAFCSGPDSSVHPTFELTPATRYLTIHPTEHGSFGFDGACHDAESLETQHAGRDSLQAARKMVLVVARLRCDSLAN